MTLKTGDRVPELNIYGDDGKLYNYSSLDSNLIILYFYPKDNTSGCSREALDFTKSYEHIKEKFKAQIIGISADSIESHKKFKTKLNIPFLLLSDPDYVVLNKYGVVRIVERKGVPSYKIIRSTFIVKNKKDIIKVYYNVKVDGHIKDIMNFLSESEK